MPAACAFAMASLGLGARRIDDADEGQQREVADQRQQVGEAGRSRRVEVALGGRHDPQALRAEALVLRDVLGSRTCVDRHRCRPSGLDGVRGPRQQLVGRALDVAADDVLAVLVLHGVERGHELVRGVERDLGDARVLLAGQHGVDAALGREHHERALGRIADEGAVLGDRVGAQRHRQQVALERHARRCPPAPVIWPIGRVALAADREALADDRHLDGGHLVERERAGLVGVDGGRRAERLDRAQPLDDGAGLGQRRRAGGKDGRDDGRQAGRDGGDRERDRGQEQDVERLVAPEPEARSRSTSDTPAMTRIWLVSAVELLGERRLLGDRALEHPRDVADLGRHARGGDDEGRRRRA